MSRQNPKSIPVNNDVQTTINSIKSDLFEVKEFRNLITDKIIQQIAFNEAIKTGALVVGAGDAQTDYMYVTNEGPNVTVKFVDNADDSGDGNTKIDRERVSTKEINIFENVDEAFENMLILSQDKITFQQKEITNIAVQSSTITDSDKTLATVGYTDNVYLKKNDLQENIKGIDIHQAKDDTKILSIGTNHPLTSASTNKIIIGEETKTTTDLQGTVQVKTLEVAEITGSTNTTGKLVIADGGSMTLTNTADISSLSNVGISGGKVSIGKDCDANVSSINDSTIANSNIELEEEKDANGKITKTATMNITESIGSDTSKHVSIEGGSINKGKINIDTDATVSIQTIDGATLKDTTIDVPETTSVEITKEITNAILDNSNLNAKEITIADTIESMTIANAISSTITSNKINATNTTANVSSIDDETTFVVESKTETVDGETTTTKGTLNANEIVIDESIETIDVENVKNSNITSNVLSATSTTVNIKNFGTETDTETDTTKITSTINIEPSEKPSESNIVVDKVIYDGEQQLELGNVKNSIIEANKISSTGDIVCASIVDSDVIGKGSVESNGTISAVNIKTNKIQALDDTKDIVISSTTIHHENEQDTIKTHAIVVDDIVVKDIGEINGGFYTDDLVVGKPFKIEEAGNGGDVNVNVYAIADTTGNTSLETFTVSPSPIDESTAYYISHTQIYNFIKNGKSIVFDESKNLITEYEDINKAVYVKVDDVFKTLTQYQPTAEIDHNGNIIAKSIKLTDIEVAKIVTSSEGTLSQNGEGTITVGTIQNTNITNNGTINLTGTVSNDGDVAVKIGTITGSKINNGIVASDGSQDNVMGTATVGSIESTEFNGVDLTNFKINNEDQTITITSLGTGNTFTNCTITNSIIDQGTLTGKEENKGTTVVLTDASTIDTITTDTEYTDVTLNNLTIQGTMKLTNTVDEKGKPVAITLNGEGFNVEDSIITGIMKGSANEKGTIVSLNEGSTINTIDTATTCEEATIKDATVAGNMKLTKDITIGGSVNSIVGSKIIGTLDGDGQKYTVSLNDTSTINEIDGTTVIEAVTTNEIDGTSVINPATIKNATIAGDMKLTSNITTTGSVSKIENSKIIGTIDGDENSKTITLTNNTTVASFGMTTTENGETLETPLPNVELDNAKITNAQIDGTVKLTSNVEVSGSINEISNSSIIGTINGANNTITVENGTTVGTFSNVVMINNTNDQSVIDNATIDGTATLTTNVDVSGSIKTIKNSSIIGTLDGNNKAHQVNITGTNSTIDTIESSTLNGTTIQYAKVYLDEITLTGNTASLSGTGITLTNDTITGTIIGQKDSNKKQTITITDNTTDSTHSTIDSIITSTFNNGIIKNANISMGTVDLTGNATTSIANTTIEGCKINGGTIDATNANGKMIITSIGDLVVDNNGVETTTHSSIKDATIKIGSNTLTITNDVECEVVGSAIEGTGVVVGPTVSAKQFNVIDDNGNSTELFKKIRDDIIKTYTTRKLLYMKEFEKINNHTVVEANKIKAYIEPNMYYQAYQITGTNNNLTFTNCDGTTNDDTTNNHPFANVLATCVYLNYYIVIGKRYIENKTSAEQYYNIYYSASGKYWNKVNPYFSSDNANYIGEDAVDVSFEFDDYGNLYITFASTCIKFNVYTQDELNMRY